MAAETINKYGSSYAYNIDTDTALSGTVLTIPAGAQGAGVWKFTSASGLKTVAKMLFGGTVSESSLPFPVTLQSESGDTNDITITSIGSAVTGNIVGESAGTVTIVGRASASDICQVKVDGSLWKVINIKNYV